MPSNETIRIYLLKGAIHSGKTTALQNRVKSNSHMAGIIAPVVRDKRYILDLISGEKRLLNADEHTAQILSIGPHRFNKETFLWARKILFTAWTERPQWLIIDEIGPLELSGEGLEPAVRNILAQAYHQEKTRVLLVVRESLIRTVYTYFKLPKELTQVITIADLPALL